MFEKMLAHPKIEVRLSTDYREARAQVHFRHLIFTGPIDEYFDHCFGPLPYRSLRFEPETLAHGVLPARDAGELPERPRLHAHRRDQARDRPAASPSTTIVREYPQDFGPGREPYYPIPAPDARALYERYAERAATEPGVSFRRPARHLSLLQHGPGRRHGAGGVREAALCARVNRDVSFPAKNQ